jgi:chemotaxis protein CheX
MTTTATTSLAEPSITDVLAVTEEVWNSFVGPEEPLLPGEAPGTDWVEYAATVTVSGAWHGMITLEFCRTTAEIVSARMLGLDDTGEEDVADAVGELVNMVGGNIKSLMPGPSTLSLPVVSTGRVARSTDTVEVCRVDLVWAGRPLSVAVHVIG